MHRVLAAGGSFLLAVLWIDLMFDVQALRRSDRSRNLPDEVLASIAAYYRRITTDAHPMSRLIMTVMTVVICGSIYQIFAGTGSRWMHVVAFVLGVGPIALAGARIFPDAVTLGARVGSIEEQSRLARGIARAHVACFLAIAGFVALQIVR